MFKFTDSTVNSSHTPQTQRRLANSHGPNHMKIQTLIDHEAGKIRNEIVTIRREIHKNPEIGLDLFNTADLIARALSESRIPFREKIGGTGVVALIEGSEPGPCILLRADMDALPLNESTGLAYASRVSGKNACLRA